LKTNRKPSTLQLSKICDRKPADAPKTHSSSTALVPFHGRLNIEVQVRAGIQAEMNSFQGTTDVDCRFAVGVASELHLIRR
jgi:hypothetical protein